MKVRVEVEEPFSLDLTLSPSFTSSMYVKQGPSKWVKVAGRFKGLRLKQVGRGLVEAWWSGEADVQSLEDAVLHEVGGWHGPFEDQASQLPSWARVVVEALASAYPGVRLPVAPWDFPYVFIAVSLSRRTRYDALVLKWCRRLWELYDGDLALLAKAPSSELREKVGSSFQVAQLKTVVEDLLSIPARQASLFSDLPLKAGLKSFLDVALLDPLTARILLLRGCRFLGPKTVDSIVLTCFKAPFIAPCDTHLVNVSSRLGLLPRGLSLPVKQLCAHKSCGAQLIQGLPRCPKEASCIRAEVSRLGDLAGWLQTLCYLHGSSTCKSHRPRCEACGLKELCYQGAEG